MLGPHVTSPITSYFRLPVVPTVLGFDPRLQFVHETDLMRVLAHAVHAEVPGTFNVAGDGVMLLSQAVRRLRKPTVALPRPAVGGLASVLKSARMADFSPEQLGFLTFGRGIDTTRMRTELGFEPDRTTEETFADFADLDRPPAGAVERVVDGLSASPASPSPAREPAVGDAEIIPIGTGGRPGRGSGSAGPRAPRAGWRVTPRRSAAPATPSREPAPVDAVPTTCRSTRGPASARRPEDRAPVAGITPGDWLAALQTGAIQVFGDDWEPQLARFLAFLRRRMTGEYDVDEYGFDQEVAERLLLASLARGHSARTASPAQAGSRSRAGSRVVTAGGRS